MFTTEKTKGKSIFKLQDAAVSFSFRNFAVPVVRAIVTFISIKMHLGFSVSNNQMDRNHVSLATFILIFWSSRSIYFNFTRIWINFANYYKWKRRKRNFWKFKNNLCNTRIYCTNTPYIFTIGLNIDAWVYFILATIIIGGESIMWNSKYRCIIMDTKVKNIWNWKWNFKMHVEQNITQCDQKIATNNATTKLI